MTNYDPGGMRRFRLSVATEGWTMHSMTHHTEDGPVLKKESMFFGNCIAQGCIFTKGFTVLRFLAEHEEVRTETFDTYEEMLDKYPEKDGSHHVRWQDKCCFVCGSDVDHNFGPSFCDQCGASWDSPADWPNPSSGTWKHVMTIPAGVDNQSE